MKYPMKKQATDMDTSVRGSNVCSLSRTNTDKKIKVVARCWVIAHARITSGQ